MTCQLTYLLARERVTDLQRAAHHEPLGRDSTSLRARRHGQPCARLRIVSRRSSPRVRGSVGSGFAAALVMIGCLLLFAQIASAVEPLRGQLHLDEPACSARLCLHLARSGNGLTGTRVGVSLTVAGRSGNGLDERATARPDASTTPHALQLQSRP